MMACICIHHAENHIEDSFEDTLKLIPPSCQLSLLKLFTAADRENKTGIRKKVLVIFFHKVYYLI